MNRATRNDINTAQAIPTYFNKFVAEKNSEVIRSSLIEKWQVGTPVTLKLINIIETNIRVHASVKSISKRLLDIGLGAALLICALPVMLVCALVIKATSSGPAIHRKSRLGLNGQSFVVYKLRTMCTDADRREPNTCNSHGRVFHKPVDDPRITPVGRILRKFSLDELPQLINVLRGEMSLVGPRPIFIAEMRRLPDGIFDPRFRVRPGLSGLWQINGRSDLSDSERMRYDHAYVDDWSFSLDLRILLWTIPTVILGSGAR